MLVSIRTVTLLILLCSCRLSAQVVQVDLPRPLDLVLDSTRIGVSVGSIAFESDTNQHTIYVIQDSSIVTAKTFKLTSGESRRYILEEDGLGGERLFYRAGAVSAGIVSIQSDESFDISSIENATVAVELNTPLDTTINIAVDPDIVYVQDPDSIEVTAETYEQALARISKIDLEFDRSQAMIAWAGKNAMTVEQIREFGELSAFDPSRFMLLQRLYPFCTDAENYGTLRDLFDFNQYKNQFSEWLATQSEVE